MAQAVVLNEAEKAFLADYRARGETLPGARLGWLKALREDAISSFERSGLPHRRVEEWKFTDLKARLRSGFSMAPTEPGAGVPNQDPFSKLDAYIIAFVGGTFRADLAALEGLPAGVTVVTLADALAKGDAWLKDIFEAPGEDRASAVQALNLGLFGDGVVVRVDDGVILEKPIRMVSAATGGAAHMRSIISVGKGAKAALLESQTGPGGTASLDTHGLDIRIAESGELAHVKLQAQGEEAVHLGNTRVMLGAKSRYSGVTLTAGGSLTRNDLRVQFTGPEGFASVSGVSLLKGTEHCDNTTVIDHGVPDCESHELFKNVLTDKARGVFQGKIIVARDAQRSNGYQMSRALLLTPGTEADTKPELEIYADDVKCSHGATVGALDDTAIFYLRSRGIPEGEAKALLVGAFAAEVIEQVADKDVRAALAAHVEEWLAMNKSRIEKAASAETFGEGDGHAA